MSRNANRSGCYRMLSCSCSPQSMDGARDRVPADFNDPARTGAAAMSEINPALPVRCPRCCHASARVLVAGSTVVTLRCLKCDHLWATEVRDLPDVVRGSINLASPESVWHSAE